MKDISFIIPVYNTPVESLKRCVESILELQNKFDIEIVVIDDGSKNHIGEFFNRNFVGDVSYRYKTNGGVSSARNMGLDVAGGRYICFVDADDVIISSAFSNIDELDAYQLIVFDIDLIENAKRSTWKVLNSKPGRIDKKDIVTELVASNRMNSACAKLFLRECIQENGIRFSEKMIIGEDMNFVIEFLQSTSNFYYTSRSAYCYQREESSRITRIKRHPDLYYDNIDYLNDKLMSLIKEYELGCRYIVILNADHINSLYNYTSDLMALKLFSVERKNKISKIVRQLQCKKEDTPKKVLLKHRLLYNENWVVIFCLAYIRILYLKLK